jgi:hypothetical protein
MQLRERRDGARWGRLLEAAHHSAADDNVIELGDILDERIGERLPHAGVARNNARTQEMVRMGWPSRLLEVLSWVAVDELESDPERREPRIGEGFDGSKQFYDAGAIVFIVCVGALEPDMQ